ncbi:MAG TPA: phage holin family protein [Gemmatimonadaceae bacterium]|jgi:drug/metabolite transporter (DMT)-like permease|nr:phage holin family protein [Gemmatimonadaceae bacterium]
MDARVHNGQSPSLGVLLRDLAEGSAALVKNEARLARLEVTEMLQGAGRGTAFVTFGAVLLLLGALAVLTGLILLGGDQWLRDRYWLAALIVFVLAGGIAMWFASRGAALLSPRRLTPEETIATLKEDRAWLKQQLTSDGTSS